MSSNFSRATLVLGAALAGTCVTVSASPIIFTGFDANANNTVDPAKPPFAARTAFEANLSSVGSLLREDFEAMTVPGSLPVRATSVNWESK